MKTIPDPYQAKLDAAASTLTTCVEITLKDGTVQRFTAHPVDLTIGANTYSADASIDPSEVVSSSDLSSDMLEMTLLLGAAGGIPRADMEAGRYDGASVRVFQVDYTDPDAGQLTLRSGELGRVSTRRGRGSAEIRGLADRLRASVGRDIQPVCDAELGDARCTVDLGPLTEAATVTAVASRQAFTDENLTAVAGTLAFGKCTWITGNNAGLSMEIRANASGGIITLSQPMPRAIQVGDTASLVPGCDKTVETCKTTYANLVNFRGFPHVPGGDAAQDRPDAK